MAEVKLTLKRGQESFKRTIGAGTTISGGNAMELNIDTTAITQSEAGAIIDNLKNEIVSGKWPPA